MLNFQPQFVKWAHASPPKRGLDAWGCYCWLLVIKQLPAHIKQSVYIIFPGADFKQQMKRCCILWLVFVFWGILSLIKTWNIYNEKSYSSREAAEWWGCFCYSKTDNNWIIINFSVCTNGCWQPLWKRWLSSPFFVISSLTLLMQDQWEYFKISKHRC